jgi:hypothetical protein
MILKRRQLFPVRACRIQSRFCQNMYIYLFKEVKTKDNWLFLNANIHIHTYKRMRIQSGGGGKKSND